VADVHAYIDGTVELTFDKYMQPATLTADAIYLKKKTDDGERLVTIDEMTLPDEEAAYEGQQETYARTVRLMTQEDLSLTKEVILIVDRSVKSYAGVGMQDTYQQTLDVEQRLGLIVADSALNMESGSDRDVTIRAIPATAAQGKTLTVGSRWSDVVTADTGEVAFDEQGVATVTLHARQSGRTNVVYTIKDGSSVASSVVNVFLRRHGNESLSLNKGWNWVSHRLCNPIAPQTAAVSQVLSAQGEVTEIGSMGGFKVKANETTRLNAEGPLLDDCEKTVLLTPGWNWVAYPYEQATRLNTAVMQAEEGDVMTSQWGFAVYEEGTWTGSLTALQPGYGYMYRSKSAKPLNYRVPAGQSVTADIPAATEQWTPDRCRYANTMNVVARLYDGTTPTTDYTVGVFDANGECRGVGQPVGHLLFITIYGNQGDVLCFAATEGDSAPHYMISETMSFDTGVKGSRAEPVSLHLTQTQTALRTTAGNGTQQLTYYNVAGQRLLTRQQGVNIVVDTNGHVYKVTSGK
jgi:hypothetical protein